ncbi:Uncharacterized protein SCF082_LOCUS15584 [Durusdinium trenchii]|uniref:Uncharacterized protein n=1 Tax=Durusdinium trenchii TaxID=1381693 RepID=A0ABP0K796_9DINO
MGFTCFTFCFAFQPTNASRTCTWREVRDLLTTALISRSRDWLKEVFGGSCQRTAKVCAVLEAARLSPERASDPRLQGCRNACESVEEVLKDLGLGAALRAAQEREREAPLGMKHGFDPAEGILLKRMGMPRSRARELVQSEI